METDVNRLMFCNARGPLNQINDVLAGKNGKLWLKGINSYLRQGAIKAFGWKTYGPFQLRFFESSDVLMAAINYKLKRDGFHGNDHDVQTFVSGLEYPIEESSVEFISLKVEELGFDRQTCYSEIEECLSSLDLELCEQSDAPRLFSSDINTINAIRNIGDCIFLSTPFFHSLRGKNDEKRPILFKMYFNQSNQASITWHWHEDLDKEENYIMDMNFYPYEKIVLRIKR